MFFFPTYGKANRLITNKSIARCKGIRLYDWEPGVLSSSMRHVSQQEWVFASVFPSFSSARKGEDMRV